MYYFLAADVEVIRQPYGAAVWSDQLSDFAVTNTAGCIILETCADGADIDLLVQSVQREFDDDLSETKTEVEVREFIETSLDFGHIVEREIAPAQIGRISGSDRLLTLVRADISITNQCNLHCAYCYTNGSDTRNNNELGTAEWLCIFEKLAEAGIKKLIITGGEPLVRPDMVELLRAVDHLNMTIMLLTNGTLIDEWIADQLARISRLREVKVSVDSLQSPQTHDQFRGVGSWARATRAMELLHERGLTVVANMTLHPSNIDELHPTARICHDRGYLLEASPVVIEGRARNEHLMTDAGLKRFRENYSDVLEKYPATLQLDNRELQAEWEAEFRCAMTFGTVGISPDGYVKPCLRSEAFFEKLDLGIAVSECLCDMPSVVLENLSIFNMVKDVRSSFVPQPDECYNCQYLHGICNGCVVAKAFMEQQYLCLKGDSA